MNDTTYKYTSSCVKLYFHLCFSEDNIIPTYSINIIIIEMTAA
jgi:hypothetical protein